MKSYLGQGLGQRSFCPGEAWGYYKVAIMGKHSSSPMWKLSQKEKASLLGFYGGFLTQ